MHQFYQDGGRLANFGYLIANITIVDVNDNPPIFDQSDYVVSLNESVPPGAHVLQVIKKIYFLNNSK